MPSRLSPVERLLPLINTQRKKHDLVINLNMYTTISRNYIRLNLISGGLKAPMELSVYSTWRMALLVRGNGSVPGAIITAIFPNVRKCVRAHVCVRGEICRRTARIL